MIRTLVIDDEPLLREYIKNRIINHNPNFTILGEAGNGEEAWQKIKKLKPDVIFIDIKMPLADGLEVLERCAALTKPPLSIILSGYSEFSYAQKALKYHAYDYILKPLDEDAMIEVLKRVEAKITLEYEQIQYEYFSHLLHNQPFNYSGSELISAFAQYNSFYTYHICIGSYFAYRYNQFSTIGDYWTRRDFDNKAKQFIADSGHIWIIHEEPQNECFLVYGTTASTNVKPQKLADRLLEILHSTRFHPTVIYGLQADNVDVLKEHFIELKNASINHTVFSKANIISLADKPKTLNDTPYWPYANQKILHDLRHNHKFDMFQNEVEQILEYCNKNNCPQCILIQLLKHICEIANNKFSAALNERIEELITNSSNYDLLKEGMADILNDVFNRLWQTSSSNVAAQTKIHIDQHYSEPISLTELAKKFNFSISYLSLLFKRAYQVSPNEYIITARLEKAKGLLLDNQQASIREIAALIGYADPYYFSRLFKMTFGVTPSEYRASS